MVMVDHRVYLAYVYAIWVGLGGLKGRWVVILDTRVNLASV